MTATSQVPEKTVSSVREYVEAVLADTEDWELIPGCSPWFRGQSSADHAPFPGILRKDTHIKEQEIADRFRKLAPMFGATPPRAHLDEWLYLMQHVGVPTRLLDWSEGALIGLYFAVHRSWSGHDCGVWLIHPLKLNEATIRVSSFPDSADPLFVARCNLAFLGPDRAPGEVAAEEQVGDIRWPIAIVPTYTHRRMQSQRGCFTLHGSERVDFDAIATEVPLVEEGFYRKYRIPAHCTGRILHDLRLLGVTHATLFPDHDGLATDLRQAFREERSADSVRDRLDELDAD